MMPLSTVSAGTLPGQRIRRDAEAAFHDRALALANGVVPPSGQVKISVPLSVVKTTIVLSSTPMSLSFCITTPTIVVELRHAGFLDRPAVLRVAHRFVLFGKVRDDVHAGRVEPAEERLVVLLGLVDELQGHVADFVVDRFHPLGIERAGVFDLLLADLAPARHLRSGRRRLGRPASGPCCAGRPCPGAPADSWDEPGLPSRRGDTGSRRTRRSRARSAETR